MKNINLKNLCAILEIIDSDWLPKYKCHVIKQSDRHMLFEIHYTSGVNTHVYTSLNPARQDLLHAHKRGSQTETNRDVVG